MVSIRINGIDFPDRALSEMKLLRDIYQKNQSGFLQVEDPDIELPTLISVKEFMSRLSDVEVRLILPRIQPVRELIPPEIMKWMSDFNMEGLWKLHQAAYILGYSYLFEITSIFISEIVDIQSL